MGMPAPNACIGLPGNHGKGATAVISFSAWAIRVGSWARADR
jgi:hypothetical protein